MKHRLPGLSTSIFRTKERTVETSVPISKRLVAAAVCSYCGGLLLLCSMLLSWPWLGRRGQIGGLTMIARADLALRQFDVPSGRLISAAWLLMPVVGAMLMILTSHGARLAHRLALGGALVALGETVLLMRAYTTIGLDPWAGGGLRAAMFGAVLAVAGTVVSCLPRRG